MTTTETNVAAQAGDEPMRAAFEAHYGPRTGFSWRNADGTYKVGILQDAWEIWQKAIAYAAQVSPRATADVERDAARYRWLRERPYSDWKRIAFNTMDDHPFAIRCRDEEIDAAIATTKPGA